MNNLVYFLIFLLLMIVLIFIKYNDQSILLLESSYDNNEYMVQNLSDKNLAVDLLANIKIRLFNIVNYLYKYRDQYPENIKYIDQMYNNIQNVIIKEKMDNGNYTSYSVNKGEEIVFCLRSKKDNSLHDINLMMYVAIHELSHIACPELNHTKLFKQIFKFLLGIGIKLNLYKHVDYSINWVEYCGMDINENILHDLPPSTLTTNINNNAHTISPTTQLVA